MSFTNPEKGKLFLRSWLQGREAYMTLEAMKTSLEYHDGLRKDGVTPEWFHQVSIALYLMTVASLDEILDDLITVVFLHDIVEDKDYPLNAIGDKWGIPVRHAVKLLSKVEPGFPHKITKSYYEEMVNSPLAAIVKGADRINNFQTMPGVFTIEKQEAYLAEAMEHILPMLKRARELYPQYRPAFENLKHMLLMQIKLIEIGLASHKDLHR